MAVFRLNQTFEFPHPGLSNEDGLLAIGGDLSAGRLLSAYCNGIFPWYSEEYPILWWSPDPRFILYPEKIHVSKSMKKLIRKNTYQITFDRCFREVMTNCGSVRSGDTWINSDMIYGYCELHRLGYAHSVETWHNDELVGGLYGVSLGNMFFGESMFSMKENASKIALITLCDVLSVKGFQFIDCQIYSKHLESLGAVNIPRAEFLQMLKEGLVADTLKGSWSKII